MKRTPLLRSVLASLACTAALAASAQETPRIDADREARATAARAATPPRKDDNQVDRWCLQQTGSRVVEARNRNLDRNVERQLGEEQGDRKAAPAGRQCTNAPGRVYTREELESTGHANLADALRSVIPAHR